MQPDHGMNGTSITHCCYKHEFKDSVIDRPNSIILEMIHSAADRTQDNNFQAIDELDALVEILEERTS